MGKVTMQDVAVKAGTSRVTVWKVLNGQTGVSDSVRENILIAAKELGYGRGTLTFSTIPSEEEKTVSLIVSRPDSSLFWSDIIHRLAQDLDAHHVSLLYTYVPSVYTQGYTLPSAITNGNISGAIILNLYDAGMISLVNQLPFPKVFLDTIPEIGNRPLHGDLLLIEGYHSVYDITASVLKKGCKKIGFLGDIHYASTNADRYTGFLKCLEDYHIPLDSRLCLTDRIDIFSYHKVIFSFLDALSALPEAFICASDYIAHFVHLYLTEHPERIPNGIILTGFDGNREYSNIDGLLTTAKVRTDLLGKRLSGQIMYRMENKDAPYELTYIQPELIYRDSRI